MKTILADHQMNTKYIPSAENGERITDHVRPGRQMILHFSRASGRREINCIHCFDTDEVFETLVTMQYK